MSPVTWQLLMILQRVSEIRLRPCLKLNEYRTSQRKRMCSKFLVNYASGLYCFMVLLLCTVNPFSTWRLHVAWIYDECTHEEHLRRTPTLTLTHTITAYSVSGNVVRVRILICATRQTPCRKRVYRVLKAEWNLSMTEWSVCVRVGPEEIVA